jgi:hypothetical protein
MRILRRAERAVRSLLGVLLVTGMMACHSNNNDQTPPGGLGGPSEEFSPLASGEFVGLSPSVRGDLQAATKLVPFSIAEAGQSVHLEVDWTYATDTVVAGVYPSGCGPSSLGAKGCLPVSIAQQTPGAAEAQLDLFARGGSYLLVIRNDGPHKESGTYALTVAVAP